MTIAFPLVAFAGALLATFRSLGWGFLAVLAVGYVSGVVRANYLGVFTTFMFDAAVLGLYLGFILGKSRWAAGGSPGTAGPFVVFLIAWPALLSLVPVNNLLVQFVALRATVWFLPILLIAARLTTADLAVLARGLVVLNLVALAGGLYVYLYGVEALYPQNPITQIIYKSNDVAGYKYHRIPSTFLSAHAYGGTMLLTLPFLLDQVAGFQVRLADRLLAGAGVFAATSGLLMCSARSPLVIFGVAMVIAWVLSRCSLKLGLVVAILVGVGWWAASTNERFQRANSLEDTEAVANRVYGSANESFLELLLHYPLGAGMGSSYGTSIPFFLADVAPEPIGMENEFSRILVDQGWVGLGGWLVFLVWLFVRPPSSRPSAPWRLGVVFMYSLTLATWLTAFIGTGTLSSIPATVLLLAQMGVLAGVRARGAVPEAVSDEDFSEEMNLSSLLPLGEEEPEWEFADTSSGRGGDIGAVYPLARPSRATGNGEGIPSVTNVPADHPGKPSSSNPGLPAGVRR